MRFGGVVYLLISIVEKLQHVARRVCEVILQVFLVDFEENWSEIDFVAKEKKANEIEKLQRNKYERRTISLSSLMRQTFSSTRQCVGCKGISKLNSFCSKEASMFSSTTMIHIKTDPNLWIKSPSCCALTSTVNGSIPRHHSDNSSSRAVWDGLRDYTDTSRWILLESESLSRCFWDSTWKNHAPLLDSTEYSIEKQELRAN